MVCQKRKKQIKNRKYLLLIGVGIFLILFASGILFYQYYSNRKIEDLENKSIEVFFDESSKEEKIVENVIDENTSIQPVSYMAILEIPKINLKRGIADMNSKENNVDRNIYVLKETTFPDEVENSNILLASHSGTSYISFFKNVGKLNLNDDIYFYYHNVKYHYQVYKKYEIEKTGTMEAEYSNEPIITLVTCKSGTNKQIVVLAKLVDKEVY